MMAVVAAPTVQAAELVAYDFTGATVKPDDLDTDVEDVIEASDMDNKDHRGCTWKNPKLTVFFVVELSSGDKTKLKALFPTLTPSGF